MSAYTSGGEEAVRTAGGQATTLLLQQLKQAPMPVVEERAGKAPVTVSVNAEGDHDR